LNDTTDLPKQPKRGGPKGLNWLLARTLAMEGKTHAEIGRAIGCARETVSRRAMAENWAEARHNVLTETSRKLDEAVVEETADVLRRHGDYGRNLFAMAEAKLAELIAQGNVSLKQLQIASSIGRNAAELERAARGISADQSFVPRDDRPFIVELQKAPDLAAFELFAKAYVRATGGDRAAAQEAWRRANELEAADTA
jgi:hypothetical protein